MKLSIAVSLLLPLASSFTLSSYKTSTNGFVGRRHEQLYMSSNPGPPSFNNNPGPPSFNNNPGPPSFNANPGPPNFQTPGRGPATPQAPTDSQSTKQKSYDKFRAVRDQDGFDLLAHRRAGRPLKVAIAGGGKYYIKIYY